MESTKNPEKTKGTQRAPDHGGRGGSARHSRRRASAIDASGETRPSRPRSAMLHTRARPELASGRRGTMRAASTICVGTFSLALAACGGGSATGPADGGTVDGTLDDSAVALDGSSLDTNDGSLADATQDSASLDNDGASNDSSLTVEDSGAPDAGDEDAASYAGPVVHIIGTAVESPSAAPLTRVTICAYAQPAIPCVTTPSTGAFDVMVPASAETGVTLAVSGRESVLVALETTTQNQVGWEIGMTAASDVEVIFSALGATYPDSTTGFLGTFASPPGGQIGVAGLTMAVVPRSGKGPDRSDRGRCAGPFGDRDVDVQRGLLRKPHARGRDRHLRPGLGIEHACVLPRLRRLGVRAPQLSPRAHRGRIRHARRDGVHPHDRGRGRSGRRRRGGERRG